MKCLIILVITSLCALTSSCAEPSSLKNLIGQEVLFNSKDLVKANWTNKITYEILKNGVTVHIAHYSNMYILTYLDGDEAGRQVMIDARGSILLESMQQTIDTEIVIHSYAKRKVYTNKYCQYLQMVKS